MHYLKSQYKYSIFQYSSTEVDLKPYKGSAMNLDTFLKDFKLADEWEILANSSKRISIPREEGEIFALSRRAALR